MQKSHCYTVQVDVSKSNMFNMLYFFPPISSVYASCSSLAKQWMKALKCPHQRQRSPQWLLHKPSHLTFLGEKTENQCDLYSNSSLFLNFYIPNTCFEYFCAVLHIFTNAKKKKNQENRQKFIMKHSHAIAGNVENESDHVCMYLM